MGFSDSQVSPIVAHKHTNSAGDGGTLDGTSLLQSGGIQAWLMMGDRAST